MPQVRTAAVVALGLILAACSSGASARRGPVGGLGRGEPAAVAAAAEPDGALVLAADVMRDVEPTRADVGDVSASETAFGLALYRRLAAEAGNGDVVASPHSLASVLGMLLGGARGTTAAEIAEVLQLDVGADRLHPALNSLDLALAGRTAGGTELLLANRVWADRGLAVEEGYSALLAREYGAPMAQLDLAADPEGARDAINAWAAEGTRGRVEELFPEGAINDRTRLVLANALALDATWEFPFAIEGTSDQPFQLGDGSTASVPTMRFDEYLPTAYGEGWQAVELPYADGGLSMVVIVPEDLAAFEADLTPERLATVLAAITDGGVHLTLPRFAVQQHAGLNETLSEMGMPSAFGGGADFSGMTGDPDLFIGAFEHEAVVEVDEQGIEAAAASGAAMQESHGPEIAVDRPFLFLVRDRPTGALLFLGRVTDPR